MAPIAHRWPDRKATVLLALLGTALGSGPRPAGGQLPEAARAPAPASPFGEAVDSARSIVRFLMRAEAIPGLSVAVARESRVLWSEGFGWADPEHRVLVTPLTRFRVGSVSKPLTAAALVLLVEEDAVDLDAPVQRYVPEFPGKRWTVTSRQLAGHVAGVRHYRGDEFLSRERYGSVIDGLEIFADDTLLLEPLGMRRTGGGFLSTAEDLARFGAAHLEPGFLAAESLELLFRSQTLRNRKETGYGIGWRVDVNGEGEETAHHTGGSVGGRTVLWLNRDRGLVVAAVANLSEAPIEPGLAEAIAELFMAADAEATTSGTGPRP